MIPLLDAALLFSAAVVAGALNSVAGGGSFISFPTLLFAGVPAISANATNTVGVWPGSLASVAAYRRELQSQWHLLPVLGGTSLIGGLVGAFLLLKTPEVVFVRLVPYLLLLATLLFAFGGNATRYLRRHLKVDAGLGWQTMAAVGVVQFVIAAYGGYFGGGIGILMLAALTAIGMDNIHTMNGLKTLLAAVINGVAVVTFVLAGVVFWPAAILMIVGAVVGGYGGAHFAQRLDPRLVRRFVVVIACAMTVYFFMRQ